MPTLSTLDTYLQSELGLIQIAVTAWQAEITAGTFSPVVDLPAIQAMINRAQTFTDFYRAGKNADPKG